MRFTIRQKSTLFTPVLELSDEDLQRVAGGVGSTPTPTPGHGHIHHGHGHIITHGHGGHGGHTAIFANFCK